MGLYVSVVSLFIFLVLLLGLVLPFLFSAASTELVAIAVLLCVVSVPIIFVWVKKIGRSINERFKNHIDA